MPTTVALTMAMTSTLMTTGCDKHMTLVLRWRTRRLHFKPLFFGHNA